MKKIVVIFLFLVIFLVPISVGATESVSGSPTIVSTSVSSVAEKEVGDEFTLNFRIGMSGLAYSNTNNLGIFMIGFELDFDDTVFTVTDVSASGFDSSVFKDEDEGKYYVFSITDLEDSYTNKCFDQYLYCSNRYSASVTFFVKKTDKTSSTIKMGETSVGVLKMLTIYPDQTEDDIVEITKISDATSNVLIKNTSNTNIKEPNTIIQTEKPDTSTKVPTKPSSGSSDQEENPSSNGTGSNNANLKSLEIEGYSITFEKDQYYYEVFVDKEVHEIKVNAELEDSKATLLIDGADDLQKSKNIISVLVTAEDGSENTYIIEVKEKEETSFLETIKKKINNIDEKYWYIGGGIAVFLILVLIIITKLRNRKIDKALDF